MIIDKRDNKKGAVAIYWVVILSIISSIGSISMYQHMQQFAALVKQQFNMRQNELFAEAGLAYGYWRYAKLDKDDAYSTLGLGLDIDGNSVSDVSLSVPVTKTATAPVVYTMLCVYGNSKHILKCQDKKRISYE